MPTASPTPAKPRKLTHSIAFVLGALSGAASGGYYASLPPATDGVCPPGYTAQVIGQGFNQHTVCGDGFFVPPPDVVDAGTDTLDAGTDATVSRDAGTGIGDPEVP